MMKRHRPIRQLQTILCLINLTVAGCHKDKYPNLVDTLGTAFGGQQLRIWNHDVRELAPIVVVASVVQNEIVARHVEAARYRGVYLDLHLVLCKRENSLQGGLSEQQLKFFYFADGHYPGAKPNPWYLNHARKLSRIQPA